MTADPFAAARRASAGGHGCADPDTLPRPKPRVFDLALLAEFNAGVTEARADHATRAGGAERPPGSAPPQT